MSFTYEHMFITQRKFTHSIPYNIVCTLPRSRCYFQKFIFDSLPNVIHVKSHSILSIQIIANAVTQEVASTRCSIYSFYLCRWLKTGVSNMAIVDVKLVSGFSVNEELLEEVRISRSHAMRPVLKSANFVVTKSLFLTVTFYEKKTDRILCFSTIVWHLLPSYFIFVKKH